MGQKPLGESARTHFRLLVPIYASKNMCIFYAGSRVCTQCPMGVTLPEDTVRREANHIHSERLRVRRQRRRAWSAAQATARERGEDTPSEPESFRGDNEVEDEDEEEGEVTPPSHFAPRRPPLTK
jgi:hypothetical protein